MTLHYLQWLYITYKDFTSPAVTLLYLLWLFITCSDFTLPAVTLQSPTVIFTIPAATLHYLQWLYIPAVIFTLPTMTLHCLQWLYITCSDLLWSGQCMTWNISVSTRPHHTSMLAGMSFVGLTRTIYIYIQWKYGIRGKKYTKYTVIYRRSYTVLANPSSLESGWGWLAEEPHHWLKPSMHPRSQGSFVMDDANSNVAALDRQAGALGGRGLQGIGGRSKNGWVMTSLISRIMVLISRLMVLKDWPVGKRCRGGCTHMLCARHREW